MSETGGTRRLGAWSALLLVVGNIVGMGIFYTPGQVLEYAGSDGWALVAWGLGGAMAVFGGFVVAECASRFPSNGGEYLYLRQGLGRPIGFLSGWTAFVAGFPGSIATLASALALTLFPQERNEAPLEGLCMVAAVTIVALLPIRMGARTVASVTIASLALLLMVILRAPSPAVPLTWEGGHGVGVAAAMVPVFFAYTGWNVVAYVAGECERPGRTVPFATLGGAVAVTGLYLAFNQALLATAGVEVLAAHPTAAIDAVGGLLGAWGSPVVRITLAAGIATTLLSTALAGPRMTAEMARRGDLPAWLGEVQGRTGAPLWATLVQGLVAGLLVLSGSFDQLLAWTSCVILLGGPLNSLAQIVLRLKRKCAVNTETIFRDPLFPLSALLFGVGSFLVLIAVARVRGPSEVLSGVAVMLTGLPVYWWLRRVERPLRD